MKKKLTIFVCIYLISLHINAQLDCGLTPAKGIAIDGTPVEIDFEPSDFTADIWAMPILAEDRLLVWVHGLGGKGDFEASSVENSWIVASSETDLNYQAMSQRPSYTDLDLTYAAGQLKTEMVGYEGSDDNTIVIAHSQGGIVSRRLDKLIDDEGAERTFGGLVTFGAPHQGARIINNINEFQPWLAEACEDLTAGPVAEALPFPMILDLLSSFVTPEEVINFFCEDILNEYIVPAAVGDLTAAIGNDYAVGAEELSELNAYEPTIPYVCFYGIETEPVMWNTVDNFLPGHRPNEYEPFMANNDTYLTDYVNGEIDNYYAKYLEWDENASYWAGFMDDWSDWLMVPCIFCPFIEADVDLIHAETVRDSYKKGYDWWVDANPTWKGIIGQDTYIASEECVCDCIFETGGSMHVTTHPNPDCGECNEMWGDCSNEITYTMETKQSDGVVLVESASTVLGMTFSEPMNDSNHFSMRNDHNTDSRLYELFHGYYGDFFTTVPR